MGLCKCPKRNVTNLFCYEHRVNVCPHCMVTNHPKCIVQSYILWLQDSDYDRSCFLCTKDLASDDCVRLLCYHVFHWNCLDHYARKLPNTTAPAGYTCPSCAEPIFPKDNVVSPVAVALREKLSTVNWARISLGLPLLSEDGETKPPSEGIKVTPVIHNGNGPSIDKNMFANTKKSDIVVHMDTASSMFSQSELSVQMPRRTFHSLDNAKNHLLDDDENKYRRRSPSYWLHRWTKFFWTTIKLQRGPRRYWILLLFAFIMLTFICIVFSTLGRMVTADDPALNIDQNPYVHTNTEK